LKSDAFGTDEENSVVVSWSWTKAIVMLVG